MYSLYMELFSKRFAKCNLTPDATGHLTEQDSITKKAVIGVVGLGYVGMPIALEFCQEGI